MILYVYIINYILYIKYYISKNYILYILCFIYTYCTVKAGKSRLANPKVRKTRSKRVQNCLNLTCAMTDGLIATK